MDNQQITVTSPLLPDLDELNEYLRDIWSRKWITNNGHWHQELEKALCGYLKVPYISLFTNGTLPLITALQALRITGEVITTPFSFVATTHSLWWNGIKPVFVDIDPSNCGINPDCIEAAITPRTTAIMPVHCYGKPCDTKRIQDIADKYGLKVIYDAAHAFGVEVDGEGLLNAGDMSTLSFHATKVYNTIEGGALVMHDAKTKQRIDYLKNFGFAGETTVVAPGINGKMDEVRSAVGLINLKHVDEAIEARHKVAVAYREGLKDIPGISYFEDMPGVRHNYSYFPIFVDAEQYGMTRDELYDKLKSRNIYGRRYFYPLISEFSTYRGLESATKENLPVAHRIAEQVICLPMHHQLSEEDIERIMDIFSIARKFMQTTGNPNQWINGYPQKELISNEIANGHCYVCETNDSSEKRVVATFCFIEGPDPTYSYIEDGEWPDDLPYYVIHRLASDGTVHGIASTCIEWGLERSSVLRVDTHHDNKVMQHLLEKNGFSRCGIIYVANGTPRIAYYRKSE